MSEIAASLVEGLRGLSAWEGLAVVLAVAYLLLAIRQDPRCWIAAIASAGIYLVLMFQSRLYMQSVLQLFYIAMAVYGWRHWRRGEDGSPLQIRNWKPPDHVVPLLLIIVPGLVVGWLLAANTDAASPYLDALAACGAVITTWMVARKVLQNWHYWFVIDAASAYLYASQGLWLTASLFILYLVLVVVGYRRWRRSFLAGA